MDDNHSQLMERIDDFPMGRGIRHYLHGWGFHFHLDFPGVHSGVGQDDTSLTTCGLLRYLPNEALQGGFLLVKRLDAKSSEELRHGDGEPHRQKTAVLVFIDEGVQNSERLVPGLTWAVVGLHPLNGLDRPFRDALELPSERLSVSASVVQMDRKAGVASPVFWL